MDTVYVNRFAVSLGDVCRIQFQEVEPEKNKTYLVVSVAMSRQDMVLLAETIMKVENEMREREQATRKTH